MEQGLEVDGDLEVRVRGVGDQEARVFGRHAGVDHLLVEPSQAGEELVHLVGDAGLADRLRHGVGELAFLVGDVALALLLEADADAMAHELVAEGARNAGDGELEPDLLQGRGVARLQALLDEVEHLLARVIRSSSMRSTISAGGSGGVGRAIGDVQGADRVVAVVEKLDLYRHRGLFERCLGIACRPIVAEGKAGG